MPDQKTPDFAAANKLREERVIQAILAFDWGDYRLHEVDELARDVLEDLKNTGESDIMDWARNLAKAVIVAAQPVSPGDVSN